MAPLTAFRNCKFFELINSNEEQGNTRRMCYQKYYHNYLEHVGLWFWSINNKQDFPDCWLIISIIQTLDRCVSSCCKTRFHESLFVSSWWHGHFAHVISTPCIGIGMRIAHY